MATLATTCEVQAQAAAEPRRWRSGLGRLLCGTLAGAVAGVLGSMAGGRLAQGLGLRLTELPGGVTPRGALAGAAIGGLLVAGALSLLSGRLAGSRRTRWVVLALFTTVALGVNTAIEAALFTTLGGTWATVLIMLVVSLAVSATVVWLGPVAGDDGAAGGGKGAAGVALACRGLRLPAAWLAFPAAYYTFGMLLMALCPWALEYYQQGQVGLRLPPAGTVLGVQLLRSALYLASVLPVLALWRGSRTRLAWTLGLSYWALVGLFGMVQAGWLPPALRVAHALEILADSLAYAWALALLLARSRLAAPAETAAASGAPG